MLLLVILAISKAFVATLEVYLASLGRIWCLEPLRSSYFGGLHPAVYPGDADLLGLDDDPDAFADLKVKEIPRAMAVGFKEHCVHRLRRLRALPSEHVGINDAWLVRDPEGPLTFSKHVCVCVCHTCMHKCNVACHGPRVAFALIRCLRGLRGR